MKNLLFVLFLFLAADPVVASSQDPSDLLRPLDGGWEEDHRSEHVAIYSRKVPVSKYRENLLVGVLDHPPEVCFRVATDYEHYPEFMPYCSYTRVIFRQALTRNRSVVYVFLYLDLPVLSNRFLTSKYFDDANVTLNGKSGCYVSSWDTVKGGEYHRTPASPDVRVGLTKAKGIEINADRGAWHFEPLEQGEKTRMIYMEWSEPGGHIPSWINNIAGKRSLMDLWSRFQRRLEKRTGREGDVRSGRE